MFDNLRKLLGRGVEAGALNRPQSAMGTLKGGTMGRAMGAARGAMPGAIQAEDGSFVGRDFYGGGRPGRDPKYQGYAPEITVDPTGRIPYTARTQQLAEQGNRYTANPTSPEFLGVDPAQFGYPADDGQNGLQQAFRQPSNSLDALRKLLRF